jgi:integrase
MRGSLKQRSKGSWSIILDLGYHINPDTGLRKRKQRYQTINGTRKEAEDKLADLLKEVKDGQYVDASTLTLGAWLREWFAASKSKWAAGTVERYRGIIERDLAPSTIGQSLIQKLRDTHLEAYYAASGLAAPTLVVHHSILQQAIRKAAKSKIISINFAADLDHKPRLNRGKRTAARMHCWTALEARRFLQEATTRGSRPAAFYTLALDSGARKGELCGLTWANLDLDAAKMHVVQQLLKPGPTPEFGPPKTGRPRTIALSAETVALLRAHRQQQRELMMAHRTTYRDFGLVFTKEGHDLRQPTEQIGQPLQANNLGQREYASIIKAAGVKPIKFHGLRHTCATLLLQARTPVHVVSERLGHSKVQMTLEIYAHVLPDMQQEAADTIGALLHGK